MDAAVPSTAAPIVMTTSELTGTANFVRPWLPSASMSAQLSTRPTPSPTSVPSSEMSTASQRTVERSCPRFMPTARSRPSSRVRSLMDSDSVLAMPMRAMMIERISSP